MFIFNPLNFCFPFKLPFVVLILVVSTKIIMLVIDGVRKAGSKGGKHDIH